MSRNTKKKDAARRRFNGAMSARGAIELRSIKAFSRINGTARKYINKIVSALVKTREKEFDNKGNANNELPPKITAGMVGEFIDARRLDQVNKESNTLKMSDEIVLSECQKSALNSLINASTTAQGVITRAKIVLDLASGKSKYRIKMDLGCAYTTIDRWQKRWIRSQNNLKIIEMRGSSQAIREALVQILSDAERSGAPAKFTEEQVVQIISLACTPPSEAGIEVSHWSIRLLAQSAVDLGIVESISPSQIAVFFSSQILNRIAVPTG
jgi:putative transposase